MKIVLSANRERPGTLTVNLGENPKSVSILIIDYRDGVEIHAGIVLDKDELRKLLELL